MKRHCSECNRPMEHIGMGVWNCDCRPCRDCDTAFIPTEPESRLCPECAREFVTAHNARIQVEGGAR